MTCVQANEGGGIFGKTTQPLTFRSKTFDRMQRSKYEWIHMVLSLRFNVTFMDNDIVVLKDFTPLLQQEIAEELMPYSLQDAAEQQKELERDPLTKIATGGKRTRRRAPAELSQQVSSTLNAARTEKFNM